MTFRYSRLNSLAGLLAVLALLLVGLTGRAEAHTTHRGVSASHSPKKGVFTRCKRTNKATGILKYSDWQFPDNLNPYQSVEAVSQETWNGMFEGLFYYNSKAKLVPEMAASLPSVKNGGIKDGGKTVIVHLKKGLRWSNGAEITSADIKFGWKIGMDKATGPACSGSCDIISRIDTPDRYTAAIKLGHAYAPVLSYGMPPVWPTKWSGAWNNNAHDAAEKLGQDSSFNFEGPNYPTNGAYQVSDFTRNNRIVLRPMKYYTNLTCGAHVQNLIFAFYSSKESMIAAAANRETDVTQNYTVADLPALQRNSSYIVSSTPGFSFEHLEFNLDKQYHGKDNPVSNANVRLALALALDKSGLIRSALSVSAKQARDIVAWTPFVNTPKLVQPFADKKITGQWDPYANKGKGGYVQPGTSQAIKDAKKLLAKTPYKDGFSIDVMTTTANPVRAAEVGVITANWRQLGVSVTPNLIPASKLFAQWDQQGTLVHGDFQAGIWGYLGSPDPDQWKYNMQSRYIDRAQQTHAAINGNDSGIHDSLIDKAFNAAAKSVVGSVRAKNYTAVQVELAKKGYWIPLYFKPQVATTDGKVSGFANNPTQVGATWNVANWKAKAS